MNNIEYAPRLTSRNAIILLIVLVAIDIFVFQDSFLGMLAIWSRSETFAHGFIVPPISLWLIWRQRGALRIKELEPNFWFLIPFVVVVVIWFVGDLVSVNSVTQLAAMASLVLLVPLLFGYSIFRVIFFPLCFLFFAVPLGEFLFPQLMEWTADFTVLALRFTGVPVYREGLQFVIPSGNWSVVEACSGIRYLIASLTVGALFAYLNYVSSFRRLIFVLISVAVPILANWFRAYLIVMLGHLSANKIATGVDHIIYGWLFFGVVIAIMFLIGARWSEPSTELATSFGSLPALSVSGNRLNLFLIFILIVAALLIPTVLRGNSNSDFVALNKAVDFSEIRPEWAAGVNRDLKWLPAYKNYEVDLTGSFVKNGKTVDVFLGYFANQGYGRKMISSDNVLVTSADPHWSRIASATKSVVVNSELIPLRTSILRGVGLPGGEVRLAVWQYYWINGFVTRNEYIAIMYGAWQKILGRGDDSAVIVFSTKYVDEVTTDAVLSDFLIDNYKNLNKISFNIKNN